MSVAATKRSSDIPWEARLADRSEPEANGGTESWSGRLQGARGMPDALAFGQRPDHSFVMRDEVEEAGHGKAAPVQRRSMA